MKKKIYIIGTGRAGSAFAFELQAAGYGIDYLTDRNPESLKKISDKICPVSFSGKIRKEFIADAELILICVQDRFIKDVISEIESFKMDLTGKFFAHISGSISSEIFTGKNFNPENVFSVHPIQTFSRISYENNDYLKKIFFGIEGGKKGFELAVEIVKSLGSEFISIPREKKYLYHAACVVSSNFLITLLNISAELIGNLGIDKSKTFEIFRPIIENTLKNISSDGLVNSLTGPFERNDVETITNHLNSIRSELPSLLPFYTLLGMETARVAFKKESLNLKNVISILDLMNEYITDESKSAVKK